MAKNIRESNVEMPVHYGPFPSALPVFRTARPLLEKESSALVLEKRKKLLQTAFGINGPASDAGDRLLIQDMDANRVLHVYKPSESYLYYDRSLVSSADPNLAAAILSPDAAKKRAQLWLEKQQLLSENTVFQGIAYTGVLATSNVKTMAESSSPQEYHTEIKACFGFEIRKMPVLGPGAKIIFSFAGDKLSQQVYFWRAPDADPVGEQALIAPEMARKYLANDPRFAHLDPLEAKIRIMEITLGYYALPPFAFQEFYFPVYQLKGIVETRGRQNILEYEFSKKAKPSIVNENLQYNFNYYLPAGSLTPDVYRLSGFPAPVQGSVLF